MASSIGMMFTWARPRLGFSRLSSLRADASAAKTSRRPTTPSPPTSSRPKAIRLPSGSGSRGYPEPWRLASRVFRSGTFASRAPPTISLSCFCSKTLSFTARKTPARTYLTYLFARLQNGPRAKLPQDSSPSSTSSRPMNPQVRARPRAPSPDSPNRLLVRPQGRLRFRKVLGVRRLPSTSTVLRPGTLLRRGCDLNSWTRGL